MHRERLRHRWDFLTVHEGKQMGPEAMRLLAQTSAEGLELLLHTMTQKSQTPSMLTRYRRIDMHCGKRSHSAPTNKAQYSSQM